MKTFQPLILTILLLSLIPTAPGFPQSYQRQSPVFFGASAWELIGLTRIDPDEICQKPKFSKVGNTDAFLIYLADYTVRLDSFEYVHRPLLATIQSRAEVIKSVLEQPCGVFPLIKYYQDVHTSLRDHQDWVAHQQSFLNAQLNAVLSEKQYQIWSRYQRKTHRKSKPRWPMPMAGPVTY